MKNPQAFPGASVLQTGMDLRDWFASTASEADIDAHFKWGEGGWDRIGTREEARYAYADAMLAARTASVEE